jgi:hypothetical protein
MMMAKKSAATEFNMSEMIRELLTENPNLSSQQAADAIIAKYPSAKINKNSFSVAFYTGRKKLGISSPGRGKNVARGKSSASGRATINLAILQTTARFLREVGGADVALEAIKQLQAIQVK